MSPHPISRRGLALLALALLPGCSAPLRTGPQTGPTPAGASVLVENRAFEDLAVFVKFHSTRHRLGTAAGLRSTRFTLPPGVRGPFSLQADPLGASRLFQAGEFTVAAGDRVEWIIEANPSLSTWFVRPRGATPRR